MNKRYFLLLCFVFPLLAANAQLLQREFRAYEIDEKYGEDYRVIPTGDWGVLVMRVNLQHQRGGKRNLELTMLSKNLQTVWERSYQIDYNSTMLDYHYSNGKFFILTEENKKHQVLQIDLITTEAYFITYNEIKNFEITDFAVMDTVIFFGGSVKEYPAVIRYDYKNDLSTVCPSINQLKADLLWMDVDEEIGTLNVILKGRTQKDFLMYFNTFDLQGKLIQNFPLERNDTYNFLTYRPIVLSNNELLLLGTYGLRNEDKAQGLYSLKVKNGSLERSRFYDFGNLKHFFRFLPEKRYDRMKARIAKRREKDKIYQLRYDLFLHPLRILGGQILMAGDVFVPQREASNSFLYNNFFWRGNSYRRFRAMANYSSEGEFVPPGFPVDPLLRDQASYLGYEWQHAFACGFDFNGNLLWDNEFSIEEDVESDYPLQFTNVVAKNDTVVFVYTDDETMRYKISPTRNYLDSITTDTVSYFIETQKTTYYKNGGILDWYDTSFLVTGIRTINPKIPGEKSRDIFFLYRLEYQAPKPEEN